MSNNSIGQPWQEIVKIKRTERDNALAPFLPGDLDEYKSRPIDLAAVYKRTAPSDETENVVTDEDDIEHMSQQVQQARLSAEQVVRAYIKRAVIGHELTNSITEVLFEDAIRQAKCLDELLQSGRPRGPLHGIPFTMKDQFNIQGHDTTIGYCGRAFNPAERDAVLVDIIKELGGIVLAKTNLPQSIMWCETENPLWSLTVNPRNPAFTPGGSTGGESALQALHSSLAGFGTDIGGSVRIPQAINGLYALKPSSSRMPYEGVPVSTEGQEHVPSSVGPMTRSLASLTYLTRCIINAKPWRRDPRCVPMPWSEDEYQEVQSRPLVVGLLLDDGVVMPHPPIIRALKELSTALAKAGHEIVPWTPEGHVECIEIMDQYYTADGCEDIRKDVEAGGEPYIPHVEALVNRAPAISVYQYWQLNKKKVAAQKRYLDKWNSKSTGRPVDVILMPTLPHVAVPHRSCRWVGYTKVWNFLDYTAMTFPVSTISKDDAKTIEYQARNPIEEWNNDLYDLDTMTGHPINLQIVGRKLEEEKVLGIAKVIESVWRPR